MPKEPLIYIVIADGGMTAAFKTEKDAIEYQEFLEAPDPMGNEITVEGIEKAYLYDKARDAIG